MDRQRYSSISISWKYDNDKCCNKWYNWKYKIFASLENWDDFLNDPIGQLLSFSGLTFYGGLIFGLFSVLYAKNII